ncbi:MAG: YsnF/AvaK domain-containing protein [Segetibacter sp.]
MTKTVVGLFNKSSEAKQAVQELLSKGFNDGNVDISANHTAEISNNYRSSADTEEENGFTKFFKNLFGDDEDNVERYSSAAARAASIVTVHAQSDDEAERAADILDDNGASDVDNNPGNEMYDNNMNRDANQSVNIIEENLEVGKRNVETGGKRLRSRIVERPVQEELRLREENVSVNRNTVNRLATDADLAAFKEGEVEMVETKEVPVVNKQARVVEEVSLEKNVTERKETIKDTGRKTELDVENIDENDKTSTY